MNKSMMIHESALGQLMDAIDVFKKIGKETNTKDARDKYKEYQNSSPMLGMSSIAKATSDLTLVFPVICSRGIAIENSSMVTKALEKNFVTMIQQLIAASNITEHRDVRSFIKDFHNNVDDTIVNLDDIYRLSMSFAEAAITHAERVAVMEDMKNIDFYLPDAINETALTDFIVHEGAVDKNTKNAAEYFSKQVIDGDFKKANELMPTVMTVNFKVEDANGSFKEYGNALISVKAKLYPISSNDVIKHVADTSSNKNWITNFFRATTREISFLKDFVLALDKAKLDAASFSQRGNNTSDKMWKVLERRALNSRVNRNMRAINNSSAAAITTLCVSQEEVEYLRKHHSVDLESLATIRNLFDSLNLIAVCIVDETLEVAKFVFDTSDPSWETISFTHLERESSDNTYKRVVNLMTKMSH